MSPIRLPKSNQTSKIQFLYLILKMENHSNMLWLQLIMEMTFPAQVWFLLWLLTRLPWTWNLERLTSAEVENCVRRSPWSKKVSHVALASDLTKYVSIAGPKLPDLGTLLDEEIQLGPYTLNNNILLVSDEPMEQGTYLWLPRAVTMPQVWILRPPWSIQLDWWIRTSEFKTV